MIFGRIGVSARLSPTGIRASRASSWRGAAAGVFDPNGLEFQQLSRRLPTQEPSLSNQASLGHL